MNHASKLANVHLDCYNIRINFSPAQTLQQGWYTKGFVSPLVQRSGAVYTIPYSNCPKAYIGQTGRSLVHRIVT